MSKPAARESGAETGFDLAPPMAASLVESMRAFGYALPSAIADLIDNSVSAVATAVWINFEWAGSKSIISVTDDGNGMSTSELVSAMRPGSKNPRDVREPGDLGRFGLGLKTASFSQCRRVTVRSKTSAGLATRCWDLNHIAVVNDWQLLRGGDSAAEPHFSRLAELESGTTVVWQELDRLTSDQKTENAAHQDHFLQAAEGVERHLGMVFHRILSGPRSVRLFINRREILPWDPFLPGEPATQVLPATSLPYRNAVVVVRPFVLPHQSKIKKAVHAAAAGPRGWNAHQGFYVYRNDRLVVAGDWLGFGWAKEEHYKLARIEVDVPNSLDLDWNIDVTKSRATPPPGLREELRRIAERTRSDAKRVYSHRGAKLVPKAENARTLLWQPMAKHDKVFYQLDRNHPMLRRALAATTDKPALNALLRLVEETVPFPHITIANSEKPGSLAAPFEYTKESGVVMVMREAYNSLVASGYGKKDAVNRLQTIWPFELFPALLASVAGEADV